MLAFIRLITLLFVGSIIAIYFYSYTRALAIAPYDTIPSENIFYPLQYCLSDSDCTTVTWSDCSQCNYARAVNKRYAQYFHDNVDYYNYPAGFNTRYCQALSREGKLKQNDDIVTCKVDYLERSKVVGSKCDTLLKLCYNECQSPGSGTRKCAYDSYPSKFLEAYITPALDTWSKAN